MTSRISLSLWHYKNIKINRVRTYSICRENVKNVFEHSNERTQTTFNKHNFTIHNKKNSHNMKWTKKKNDIIFQSECKINVNILQNSLFFSMLYLFYNANLLKSYKNVKLHFNVIKFINDINILTYNESTKRNCEISKKTWNKVVEWTKKYDFKFNK